MKKFSFYIIAIISAGLFTSCEKVVDVNVPVGDPVPYIDAWITDQPGEQVIKFQKANGYFDNSAPPVIGDAQITLTDITAGKNYDFAFSNGAYRYNPGAGVAIGVIGHEYKLTINWQGETFVATDNLPRVSPVDSITYEYKKEESDDKEGYYAKFYAVDIKGGKDYTWIRTYLNGKRNQNVQEMWAIDGSYYEDADTDGQNFIAPIRDGINYGKKPYVIGDKITIQMRGISKGTFKFINMLTEQLSNGGLFAKVLANVPNNMASTRADSKTRILGWFATVSETELSEVIK